MGKKLIEEEQHSENEEDDEEEMESENSEQESSEEGGKPTEQDIVEKFGLNSILKEKELAKRLEEIEKNFYNRLESARLIKKQGKVPFTEHMTISKYRQHFI